MTPPMWPRGWDIGWAGIDDGHAGAHTRRPGLTWAPDQLAHGSAGGVAVAKCKPGHAGWWPTSPACCGGQQIRGVGRPA
jgi:hypothetical protein